VSTIDPDYAYVAFGFPTPFPRGCQGFKGTIVLERGPDGRWRQVVAGSESACDGAVPEHGFLVARRGIRTF
jgi:hypothetical protein